MEHIVFLDRDSIVAQIRRPVFAHQWQDYPATRPADRAARLASATIAISNKVVLDAALLRQLPRLRMIAVCATGTDNVDLDYCRAHNIAVANVRHYAQHTVPEQVLMLMLALRRQLFAYRDDLTAGAWQRSEQFCLLTHPMRELYGDTLGIVGRGELGRAVGALAQALGMQVIYAEHKAASTVRPGYLPFQEVLARSHILSLHCPLTPATRGLIGAAEFAAMRRDALLINTARGGLVDEAALLDALRAGRIAGAGIDVLSAEPPADGNVLLDVKLPNLVVTPHIAWAGSKAMQTMADELIENIEAWVRGEARNRIV